MKVFVTILLINESIDQALRSIRSVVRWHEHATSFGLNNVEVMCVLADPEFLGAKELKFEFPYSYITFRYKNFDKARPIITHARELLDEAEPFFESKDFVLVLAPGHILTDYNLLTDFLLNKAINSRIILVADHQKSNLLPVAILYSVAVQRTRGLLLYARDARHVQLKRTLLGRKKYISSITYDLNEPKVYNAHCLIGALTSYVQERCHDLRIQAGNWAK